MSTKIFLSFCAKACEILDNGKWMIYFSSDTLQSKEKTECYGYMDINSEHMKGNTLLHF